MRPLSPKWLQIALGLLTEAVETCLPEEDLSPAKVGVGVIIKRATYCAIKGTEALSCRILLILRKAIICALFLNPYETVFIVVLSLTAVIVLGGNLIEVFPEPSIGIGVVYKKL